MPDLEVSNPGAMFAEESNIDICLGSDSGNFVISNPGEGKKGPETPVWPDNQHVSQTRYHLLNLQRGRPVLSYPVQPIVRATSGRENGLT